MPFPTSRLVAQLAKRLVQTVTIQSATITQDATGAPVSTWANLASHISLPSVWWQPTGGAGGERRLPDGTFLFGESFILIAGTYPLVTEAMRAVTNGVTYDILLVAVDPLGINTTLTCQLVR